MTIQDFIVMLDVDGMVFDPLSPRSHQSGTNGGKQSIMRMIKRDAELLAYGVHAGMGVMIGGKEGRLYAYMVRNLNYPPTRNHESKPLYWSRMEVPTALKFLLAHDWEESEHSEDVHYVDNPSIEDGWECESVISVTIMVERDTDNFREVQETMSIYRTKTGRIRVKIEQYVSSAEVGVSLSRLETLPSTASKKDAWHHCNKIWNRFWGYYILYACEDIPPRIRDELIAHSVQKKLTKR